MRLQQYILEDYKKLGRGKEISEEQALKLIPKFSQAIKSIFDGKLGMGRTVWKKGLEYYLIDPKKSIRRSANTYNYYTLIIDNSKKWSKYPKRSKSIICRSIKVDPHYMYDPENYLVLPKNNSKIGECPADDFWFSFIELGNSMNELSQTLNRLLNFPRYTDEELELNLIDDLPDLKEYDKNYSLFKKACKRFDNWVKNETMFSINEIKKLYFIQWLNNWKGDPILKYLDNILDPKKHDFRLSTIKNIMNKSVEIWTDAECLMINEIKVKNFLNKAKKLI